MLLTAIGSFLLYFALAIGALILFKVVYTRITPHDEWKLIKEEQNTASAIAFGGAIVGFALALSGAISNSVSLADFLVWAIVALIAQTVAFAIVRYVFMPKIVARIEQNEISAGIILGAVSVAVGLINAASMTY